MSSLSGKRPGAPDNTFAWLLHLGGSGPLTDTARPLYLGDGTVLPIGFATGTVNFTATTYTWATGAAEAFVESLGDLIGEGGGTTLTNYSQIEALNGYPSSFPNAEVAAASKTVEYGALRKWHPQMVVAFTSAISGAVSVTFPPGTSSITNGVTTAFAYDPGEGAWRLEHGAEYCYSLDPDATNSDADPWLLDWSETSEIGGLSSVTIAPQEVPNAALANGTISGTVTVASGTIWSYANETASDAHLTGLGVQATGLLLAKAATPEAANAVLKIIRAVSTAQIDATNAVATGYDVTGCTAIELEANAIYELNFQGRFTSGGGSGALFLRASQNLAGMTVGANGIFGSNQYDANSGNRYVNSDTLVQLFYANIGTRTNKLLAGTFLVQTGANAPTVSFGWCQWSSGTVAGTSSLLAGMIVNFRKL
jgi:hypothetical protein